MKAGEEHKIVVWQCLNCGWNHYKNLDSVRTCAYCGTEWVNVPTIFHLNTAPKKAKP